MHPNIGNKSGRVGKAAGVGSRPPLLASFIVSLAVILGFFAAPVLSREQPSPVSPEILWEKAMAAVEQENPAVAADFFERLNREFPGAGQAEEALWRAATFRKQAAEQAVKPDWAPVRDLFRRYHAEYPKSSRNDLAYLEIGVSHFRMRFFREALTYFRLFEERYPHSLLMAEARDWRANTLLAVGQVDEAIAMFKELLKAQDQAFKIKVLLSLATAYDFKQDYSQTLATLEQIMSMAPRHHLVQPEVLFRLGLAYGRLGREEEKRRYLLHFINLAPVSARRTEALFETGESYYRQARQEAAQRFYAQALQEGQPDERAVVLARFRQAQYLDAPERQQEKWRPQRDPNDRAGDQPYLMVIDLYRLEPIAQDARYALLRRYQARGDQELALELAREFVRHAKPGQEPEAAAQRAGELLLYLVEELLKQGEYERIYQLYQTEHPKVLAYRQGRLRYLIGRAFEALALHEQASVLYYRALADALTEDDRDAIYVRRARLYLAMHDLAAADRLLAHLRKIYAASPRLGEALYLSGRLAQAQKQPEAALAFFRQAMAAPASPHDYRDEHAEAHLRTLLVAGRDGELLSVLSHYHQEGWLPPPAMQAWARQVGDLLRHRGMAGEAIVAYRLALAPELPADGETAQAANLQLGTLLARQGEIEAARAHLGKALAGPDSLTAKVATEQLNRLEIDQVLGGVRTLFEPL